MEGSFACASAPLRPLFALAALLLPACGASEKATDPNWSNEAQEVNHPLRETEEMTPATPAAQLAAQQSGLLGVRHDLMLASGAHTARCNCLAVEVAPAADPRFFWTAGAPTASSDAVAVALDARGVPCTGGDADEKRRPRSPPSIRSATTSSSRSRTSPGPPARLGRADPKPGPNGAVYVKPRDAKVIYAKGAPGGRCKVR